MLPELLSDLFRLAFPDVWSFSVVSNLYMAAVAIIVAGLLAAGLGAIVLTKLGAPESGQSPQPST